MPTLIWIKEKEGIFCTGEASSRLQSVDMGRLPKFNDDESDLPPAVKPSSAGIP
jgi:hypothetical protein